MFLKHLPLAEAPADGGAAAGAPPAAPPAAATPPADAPKPDAKPTDKPAAPAARKSALGAHEDKTPERAAAEKAASDKAAADKKAADDKAAGKDEAPIEIKLPDGFAADDGVKGEFQKIAKDLGLKSDGAQKLVDLQVKLEQARAAEVEKQEAKWMEEIKALPANVVSDAKRFMLAHADADTQSLLVNTWVGSHPGMIKLMAAAGKMIKPDTIEEGGQGRKVFNAEDMFPSMKKK